MTQKWCRYSSRIHSRTFLFLIYINDIVDDIQANINLFADDDRSLSMTVGDPADVGSILQSDIDKLSPWTQRWLVKFNLAKSDSLVLSHKHFKLHHPSLFMSNTEILSVTSHKHLLFFSNDGSWDIHINKSIEIAWKRIWVMRHLKIRLDRLSLQTIYFSFIRPLLEYGDVISPPPYTCID